MTRITTLKVHRKEFNLAYRSHFLRSITQNQYIFINEHQIHKVKNIRLKQNLQSTEYDFDCHVIFSNLSVTVDENIYFVEKTQAQWINEIVISTMMKIYISKMMQYHFRFFRDVKLKVIAFKKMHSDFFNSKFDVKYTILERFLNDLWLKIIFQAFRFFQFRDLFLVISDHDLKNNIQRVAVDEIRKNFYSLLDRCFYWNFDRMSIENSWIDLNIENISNISFDIFISTIATTFLRKKACFHHWIDQFKCRKNRTSHTITRKYTYELTRNCDSSTITLRIRNILRQHEFIAYNKIYNLHKNVFWSLYRKEFFDNSQFEELAYFQKIMIRWYAAAMIHKQIVQSNKRQTLSKAFFRTIDRAITELKTFKARHFEMRQKYRINWIMFEKLNLDMNMKVKLFELFSIINRKSMCFMYFYVAHWQF